MPDVDVRTLGVCPSAKAFALQSAGDSMTGKGILDGAMAVIEPDRPARPGDVVTRHWIDGESTLKSFGHGKARPACAPKTRVINVPYPARELLDAG